jgi:hypothetical protein
MIGSKPNCDSSIRVTIRVSNAMLPHIAWSRLMLMFVDTLCAAVPRMTMQTKLTNFTQRC